MQIISYLSCPGIALLFFRLAETAFKDLEKGKDLLNVAEQVLKSSNRRLGEKRITFLCGDAGNFSWIEDNVSIYSADTRNDGVL